jgi:hypothetical protein
MNGPEPINFVMRVPKTEPIILFTMKPPTRYDIKAGRGPFIPSHFQTGMQVLFIDFD